MHYVLTVVLLLFATSGLYSQGLAVNTDGSTANTSSLLDVKSINRGVLLPRMTTVQRDVILTPATGLIVFNTSTNEFNYYDGSTWQVWNSNWIRTGNHIYNRNFNTGFVGIGTSTPLTRLYVADSPVVFTGPSSIQVTGTLSSSLQGAGIRMLWFSKRAAFRVGEVSGAQWNNDSIGLFSFAAGYNTRAIGIQSFSAGLNNRSFGTSSSTLGQDNTATGAAAVALGSSNTTSGDYAFAAGQNNQSTATGTIALGYNTIASGNYSFAAGNFTRAMGTGSFAIGDNSFANNDYAFAAGLQNTASGPHAVAMGQNNLSAGSYSFVGGIGNYNNSNYSFVYGTSNTNTTSITENSFIFGSTLTTTRPHTFTFGLFSRTQGDYAFAFGANARADGNYSFAFGNNNQSNLEYSFTTGQNNRTDGRYAFTGGNNNINSSGWYNFMYGDNNTNGASATNTLVFGSSSSALQSWSMAFGSLAQTQGQHSFSFGRNTRSNAEYSFSFGNGSVANGQNSFSFGLASIASGLNSFAFGDMAEASGVSAYSFGASTRAFGNYSFAQGINTISIGVGTFTIGMYNDASSTENSTIPASDDRIFQIGNGTSSFLRSNAVTVLRNGNVGFGNTTPLAPLHFNNGGQQKIILSGNDVNNNNGIGLSGSGVAVHAQNGNNVVLGNGSAASFTPRLLVDGISGNIGIGTTSPGSKLHIVGTLRIEDGFQGAGKVLVSDAAGEGTWQNLPAGYWSINGTHIYNNNTGNVGIGINNPQVALSFAQVLGKKISLYRGGSGDAGFGVFGNELRIHSDYNGADITFGYDNLSTGFTENVRLKANGNVGIGTNNPIEKLVVSGTASNITTFNGGNQMYITLSENGSPKGYIGSFNQSVTINDVDFGTFGATNGAVHLITQGIPRLTVLNGGNVGIGTTAPSQALHVIGNILASGTITPSDLRFKNNIQSIQSPLSKILLLNGVTYFMNRNEFPEWNFDSTLQYGVIAQEVEKLFPEMITTINEKGYKGVNYVKLIPVLIEGFKELNNKADAAQKENAVLKEQMLQLIKRIEALEQKQ
jgi:Chaperone of endosialidase/Head domain of trimeric autotransporter adhesin